LSLFHESMGCALLLLFMLLLELVAAGAAAVTPLVGSFWLEPAPPVEPVESLLLGETGGVIPAPGLVLTDIGPPAPDLAYFSGLEIPVTGVCGSRGRGGRERGDGDGKNAPWGKPE